MASVTGFDPANSGQEPVNSEGNKIPVGVWGDSNTGVGIFGTSGTHSRMPSPISARRRASTARERRGPVPRIFPGLSPVLSGSARHLSGSPVSATTSSA